MSASRAAGEVEGMKAGWRIQILPADGHTGLLDRGTVQRLCT